MKPLAVAAIALALLLPTADLQALDYKKNPTRAMLCSALVPGGGQFYNQAYLKAGVVAGLQAYLIGLAVHHNNRISHFQDLLDSSPEALQPAYRLQRDDYRDKLRSDYWWIGTVLLLSVGDAFVDAHLHNYETERRQVNLKFAGGRLQLEYRF